MSAVRFTLLLVTLLGVAHASALSADLPTVTVDHLYYLRSRGEHLRKLTPDDVIDYCIAQKIGGSGFEDLYHQLFQMRIELTNLQRVDGLSEDDPRVKKVKKSYAAQYGLLSEEAQRIQRGIVREGVIATETLEAMGRAQQGRQ
jgi:hypothetical protein